MMMKMEAYPKNRLDIRGDPIPLSPIVDMR